MIGENLEKYSFEYLMTSALSRVSDDVDKREGSIIYDALAPACYELADFYMQLREVILNSFVTTSYGEYLDNRVIEQGITRYSATKAIKKGVFTFTEGTSEVIQIGSRFSPITEGGNLTDIVYKVIEQCTTDLGVPIKGEYLLQCETLGTIGNGYIGDLLPITYISNITSAKLTSLVTAARDEEEDNELKDRYILAINQKPFGGNVDQYDQVIRSINGVGEVQIYPTWNGGGTVKCSIVDTEYNPATQELINIVQEIIDPLSGEGIGLAPIGHKVTIGKPDVIEVSVSATIQVMNGYIVDQIRDDIMNSINSYFDTLKRSWGIADNMNNYNMTVYISQVTMAILKVTGVANVTDIKINGVAGDLELMQSGNTQQIPVLKEVII